LLYDSVHEHTLSFPCIDLWTMAITQKHIHNSHPSHDSAISRTSVCAKISTNLILRLKCVSLVIHIFYCQAVITFASSIRMVDVSEIF
jgi:hypothetical protein